MDRTVRTWVLPKEVDYIHACTCTSTSTCTCTSTCDCHSECTDEAWN